MDIEQLKLILDTMSAATEAGKDFAIWWLILGFVTDVLIIAGWVAVPLVIISIIRKIFDKIAEEETEQERAREATRMLRELYFQATNKKPSSNYHLFDSEYQDIIAVALAGKEAIKEKK